MHATQVHPVTTENQFHCTRLYMYKYEQARTHMHAHAIIQLRWLRRNAQRSEQ